MWDLWTKRHWDGFFFQDFGFSQKVSIHWYSIPIFLRILLLAEVQVDKAEWDSHTSWDLSDIGEHCTKYFHVFVSVQTLNWANAAQNCLVDKHACPHILSHTHTHTHTPPHKVFVSLRNTGLPAGAKCPVTTTLHSSKSLYGNCGVPALLLYVRGIHAAVWMVVTRADRFCLH